MKTFSVNALTELLERDRATITRALRHTPPDGKERGQGRWKLTTALDALDQLPGSHNARTAPRRRAASSAGGDFTEQLFYQIEAFTRASDAVVEITNAPFAERKAMAPRVFAKMEALKEQYEKAEPDGLSEAPREILGQMFSGLLHACHLVITEDDGETPLKSFYGDAPLSELKTWDGEDY
jgi:hypothetical protein